jgi:predicted outer membrane repeat protein
MNTYLYIILKVLTIALIFVTHSLCGQIIYVDSSATGLNNGNSWGNAYTLLQSALNSSLEGDTIWVAEGTYYPTQTTGGTGDTFKTFNITNEIKLFGGFDGSETTISQRDWETNMTILSGDLGVKGDSTDNAFHVLFVQFLDGATEIDGFTVTQGNADYISGNPFDRGGGIFINSSDLSISNCHFTSNSALWQGGAIYSGYSANIIITNCKFSSNVAVRDGGAIANHSAVTAYISNCVFDSNYAHINGGAIKNSNNFSGQIINSTFTANTANNDGGAIYNYSECSPDIFNCIFLNNRANDDAGAVANLWTSNPRFYNCIFYSNSCGTSGGAIYNYITSSPDIINCLILDNAAEINGGGIYEYFNSSPHVTNTIIWGNSETGDSNTTSASIYNLNGCNPPLTNSLVANCGGSGSWNNPIGIDAGNNLDENPLFINSPTDLHLRYGSPCRNGGINDSLELSDTLDLDGNMRIINSTVDIGPYEFRYNFPCGQYDTLVIDDTPIYKGLYRAMNAVVASGLVNISSGGPVTFESTINIILGPGFESQLGAVFEAKTVNPCVD